MTVTPRSITRLGILGAGAWGTALALLACRAGLKVTLQAHEPEVAEAIRLRRENPFLPGLRIDAAIEATNDPAEAVDADAVLLAVPAQFVRAVTGKLRSALPAGTPLVICAKGIEQKTGALMSEVVAETLPAASLAVLSGPTFAAEVARGLPTAVTLAAKDGVLAETLSARLGTPRFRIYHSTDPVGVEIGGAVKNVLAVACGIVAGLGLGDNTRAALITRGLTEIGRLSVAKGGRMETLMGLSGLGDAVLTCTATQSRNFSLGVALGQGRSLSDALAGRTSIAEGVFTAASVTALARRLGVDMPICKAVDGILNGGADIGATVEALLSRPFKAEVEIG
jgi:glycerol-3-phosphate dehydrogenase (NAD(P)+)